MAGMKTMFLLVDFENVKDVDLALLPPTCHVRIFVGKLQNNIPFTLTEKAHGFGDRLKWVKIAGDGRNNLDFHLAYHLGRLACEFPDAEFVILSKDKDFDSLITHLGQQSVACGRIGSMGELKEPNSEMDDPHFKRISELLSKIERKSRPRKRKTLMQHISAHFQKKLPPKEVQRIMDVFFAKRLISETNNVLTYAF